MLNILAVNLTGYCVDNNDIDPINAQQYEGASVDPEKNITDSALSLEEEFKSKYLESDNNLNEQKKDFEEDIKTKYLSQVDVVKKESITEVKPDEDGYEVIELSEVISIEEDNPESYEVNLEEAINMALENNSIFNIQKKQTKIHKIKATKSVLAFLPVFRTDMQYSYQTEIADLSSDGSIDIPGIGVLTFVGFKVEDNWKRQNTVSATQTLTGLYRKYHIKRMAYLSFDKALVEEEYAANGTALAVYDAYFNVLTSKYQLEACKKNVDELQSYYNLAYARYEEGTALKRDAQKVEVELDKAKYMVFAKSNELEDNINWLKKIIGILQSAKLDIRTNYEPLKYNISVEEAINMALENNQEIKKYGIDIKIAKHAKKEEFSNYIPDLDLSVMYLNQKGSEFYPENNFLLAFNMNFNIFDWGQRELTIKEKQLQVEQTMLAFKDKIESVKVEVKEKYHNVKEAEMLIGVSQNAVDLAKRNLDISKNRYKVGLQLITEVLGDQSDLASARSDYYEALFDEQKAIAKLKQSMGILIP
ncbi:MAG: TolC family protein [Cyanobacteriota bacterium]